jgi:hypothetical protein
MYKLSATVYWRYMYWVVFMCSYMHFHSLYCSLCTIITIICLVMTMLINIVLILTTIWTLVGNMSHLSWLFTIIECLQHASIWTSLRQYEVVLEDTISILSLGLSTIDWANYFWSIILQVLHESGLSVIHSILRWMMTVLLVGVVESWCSCVRSGAEITLIHLILFVHQYYAVILLMSLTVSSFEAAINSTSNWASSVWELTSCLFIWLV